MMKKQKFANMTAEELEQKLRQIADYNEFAGEQADARAAGELSEEDLGLVSAANAIPPFQAFLDKMKNGRK